MVLLRNNPEIPFSNFTSIYKGITALIFSFGFFASLISGIFSFGIFMGKGKFLELLDFLKSFFSDRRWLFFILICILVIGSLIIGQLLL